MSMFVEFRRMTTIGILGGLAAAGMGYAQADELVKIGHVAPLTGPNAEWGKDTENGARLAVEETGLPPFGCRLLCEMRPTCHICHTVSGSTPSC